MTRRKDFVVCLRNDRYRASLVPRKLYESVADEDAESCGCLRVVDESGEDYLFPASLFMRITLTSSVIRALAES